MIRLRPSGVDELLIKRVRDWYEPGPGVFITSMTGASFSPAMLFAAGEPGVYFDPNSTATLFEDAAGTIPTALERPVGLMLDLSGRGNHATSSSTARPTLTRRVNLLSNTEGFDNPYWSKSNTAISANVTTAPNGTTTADLIYPLTSGVGRYVYRDTTGQITGTAFITRISLKSSGIGFAYVYNVQGNSLFYINLATGTTSNVGANISNLTSNIDVNGWVTVSFTSTLTAGTTSSYYVGPCDASGSTQVTANGTNGIYVWGADLRFANTGANLPAYQRVGDTSVNAADYDTTGFPAWLRCSGGQSMVTPSINFASTDKMTVWAGVRKLGSNVCIVAELSSGISGATGAFATYAPAGNLDGYQWWFESKGTALGESFVNNAQYKSPDTRIVSGIGNISGGQSTLRLNGSQVASNMVGQGSGNYGNYPLYLFARNQSSLFFNGLAGPIIVRGAQSSAAEIANAENWINAQQKVY